jgi:hypothetical protein
MPGAENCQKIYADNPKDAAEKYAENLAYQGDLPSGGCVQLVAVNKELTEVIIFEVEVVPVPLASAKETQRRPYPAESEATHD